MSFVDICDYCDGSGKRDFLCGARCYHCGGTGIREEPEDDEFYDDCDWEQDDRDDGDPKPFC